MKELVLFVVVVLATTVIITTSRGQSTLPSDPRPTSSESEPTDGIPVSPNTGDENSIKSPFIPFGIGPPEAAWSYNQLGLDEKAVVDRGRDVVGWEAIHSAYRAAAIQRSAQARALAAAARLGVANLDTIGVVP
jgi:hypothetical protein